MAAGLGGPAAVPGTAGSCTSGSCTSGSPGSRAAARLGALPVHGGSDPLSPGASRARCLPQPCALRAALPKLEPPGRAAEAGQPPAGCSGRPGREQEEQQGFPQPPSVPAPQKTSRGRAPNLPRWQERGGEARRPAACRDRRCCCRCCLIRSAIESRLRAASSRLGSCGCSGEVWREPLGLARTLSGGKL